MQLQTSTESAHDYCVQKATPDGSNLYYACLFEEESHKRQIIALHAYLTELTTILLECSDPGIARIKLQWWLEELDRLANQQPRHPVTRYIQQHIAIDTNIIENLKEVVIATENMLLLDQPDSLQAALNIFHGQAGKINQLCARLSGNNNENFLDKLNDITSSYHYLQAILQPRTFITESCCLIPSVYIQQSSLFAEESNIEQHQQQLQILLKDLQLILDKHSVMLTRSERQYVRYVVILNRMAKKTIIKMQSHVFPWSIDLVNISPIGKLMLAWWTNTSLRF